MDRKKYLIELERQIDAQWHIKNRADKNIDNLLLEIRKIKNIINKKKDLQCEFCGKKETIKLSIKNIKGELKTICNTCLEKTTELIR